MGNVLKVKEGDETAAFGPPEDFSGEFQVYRKNGRLVHRGEYRNGKQHGQQCSYWNDGKLAQVGYARYDKPIGTWLHFMEGGMLMYEERFSDREGTYSKRWYDPMGRVDRIVHYRGGVEFVSREISRGN